MFQGWKGLLSTRLLMIDDSVDLREAKGAGLTDAAGSIDSAGAVAVFHEAMPKNSQRWKGIGASLFVERGSFVC